MSQLNEEAENAEQLLSAEQAAFDIILEDDLVILKMMTNVAGMPHKNQSTHYYHGLGLKPVRCASKYFFY